MNDEITYEQMEMACDANFEAWRQAKDEVDFYRALYCMIEHQLDKAGVPDDDDIFERIQSVIDARDGFYFIAKSALHRNDITPYIRIWDMDIFA